MTLIRKNIPNMLVYQYKIRRRKAMNLIEKYNTIRKEINNIELLQEEFANIREIHDTMYIMDEKKYGIMIKYMNSEEDVPKELVDDLEKCEYKECDGIFMYEGCTIIPENLANAFCDAAGMAMDEYGINAKHVVIDVLSHCGW